MNCVVAPKSKGPLAKFMSDYIVIGLNSYMTLYQYFEGKTAERCSTFIATGSATSDGRVVMAHNTHTDFASGQLLNIIMKITPEKGHEFVMQTSPGLIASSSDWFITKAGIVGCESTISSTTYDIVFGVPLIGSERVDVKGEISHATLNIVIETGDCYPPT